MAELLPLSRLIPQRREVLHPDGLTKAPQPRPRHEPRIHDLLKAHGPNRLEMGQKVLGNGMGKLAGIVLVIDGQERHQHMGATILHSPPPFEIDRTRSPPRWRGSQPCRAPQGFCIATFRWEDPILQTLNLRTWIRLPERLRRSEIKTGSRPETVNPKDNKRAGPHRKGPARISPYTEPKDHYIGPFSEGFRRSSR